MTDEAAKNNFGNRFPNLSDQFFPMAQKSAKHSSINDVKMAFFSEKSQKIVKSLEALLPDFYRFQRLGSLPLDPCIKRKQILLWV